MGADAQMKKLFAIFGHSVYWAGDNFLYPGLYIWTGKKNQRIFIKFW